LHERVILAVGTEPAATDIFLCDFLPAAIAEIEDKTHGIIEILVWRLIPQPLDDPARVWQRDTRALQVRLILRIVVLIFSMCFYHVGMFFIIFLLFYPFCYFLFV
jgi:hypothetical protein